MPRFDSRMMSLTRNVRIRRALGGWAVAFAASAGLAYWILSLTWPQAPVHIHLRWTSGVTEGQRAQLEQRFRLTESVRREGSTWEYQLADASTENIRGIVQSDQVADTEHLNRARYRPEFAQDRARQIPLYAGAAGAVASLLLLALVIRPTASFQVPWSAAFTAVLIRARHTDGWSATVDASALPGTNHRATAAVIAAGILACASMTWFAGSAFWAAVRALLVVYACGYLCGSLLVPRVEGVSLALIRTVAGLLLTTVGFLLALVLSLPWFSVPGALVAAAVLVRGRRAFSWPRGGVRFQWDGVATAILCAALVSPIVITFFFMAPGRFPPVLYNIDTAYFLEKVHGLVATDVFPPESRSNVGIRRSYHYGTQAMAALVARSSGLLPHHAVFLIVLPLLTAGVVAAAVATSRHVCRALPLCVAVPLLLISTPSLSTPFWTTFGPQLWSTATSPVVSLDILVGDYAIWGFLSNEGQNVGGDFLILSAVAGIAAAPVWGWWLPVFLIGTAILVKTPVGIALLAGFVLADAWRAAVTRRFWPSPQVVLACTVFVATVVAFFAVSFESEYRVQLSPLSQFRETATAGNLPGVGIDVLWLILPVLIVVSAGIGDPEKRSAPLLIMAVAPILVVNATGLDNISTGGGGTGGDWVQILHPVPFLLHAFGLSLASRRWSYLGRGRRIAVLCAIALTILPVVTAAARYSFLLLRAPETGNDFVDNRSLAEALAAIPTTGTIIVTNDLRYPAQNFTRDDRQMQIPALFGHQAFAVNYAHEAVEERRALQQLLQRAEWSESINEAARRHGWTHLLIRKDYIHPAPIPAPQIFENELYAVFRFR